MREEEGERDREREEMAANLRMVKRLDQIMTQVITWKPRVEKERSKELGITGH